MITLRSLKVELASCSIFSISGKRIMASDAMFVRSFTKSIQLFVNVLNSQKLPFYKRSHFTNGPILQTLPFYKCSHFTNAPIVQTLPFYKLSLFTNSPILQTLPFYKRSHFTNAPIL